MEQMMECLQAKVREFHKKMNASQEWTITKMDAWLEEMKAGKKDMMAC
jgi:hypothetical protein